MDLLIYRSVFPRQLPPGKIQDRLQAAGPPGRVTPEVMREVLQILGLI